MSEFWVGRKALVTGGASFIGSHLVDALLARGATVTVVDDLTSGALSNIAEHLAGARISFCQGDLRDPGLAKLAMQGQDIVFHLAADHGGRGYVDTFQAGPASNLFLDGLVFWEALRAGVKKVVYASSGCVYPNYLQGDVTKEVYLRESLVVPPYDADNLYGWAKLMGELTLQAYAREHGIKTATCRYFTVYGPRAKENHAVIALIAKAFVRQDPFEVWGTGEQLRNWTFVGDIVEGTILAAEKIDDGTPVNLGTMERIRVLDAVEMVFEMMHYRARIQTQPDMPTGPMNRIADNALARERIGWQPQVLFRDGLRKTIEWYVATKNPKDVARILKGGGLLKRKVEAHAPAS
jgi:nucleoside-diphosphate-sugar epimerase